MTEHRLSGKRTSPVNLEDGSERMLRIMGLLLGTSTHHNLYL
jgi:hypothetical protein